jgi:hypothetical protein
LRDPQAPRLKMKNLLVGLSVPDYTPAIIPRNFGGGGGGRGGGRFGRGGGGGFGGFGLAGGGEDEAAATNQNSFGGGTNSNFGGRFGGNFINNYNTNFFGRFGTNGFGTNGFRGRFGGGFGLPRVVEWQNDAKNYEFWVHADANGNFKIPNVRPGNYTLHAIADGVLGDLSFTNVTVEAGKNLSLGNVNWQPVRYGKQLWDVGIPNRSASEFFKGDDYFHWGWYIEYPKLFPVDVNYTIGKSDYRKDWFIEQVPYNTDTNNTTGNGRGDGTVWAVIFNLKNAPQGRATLRLAICGIGTRTLDATMNSRSIGSVTNLVYNATINRDGIGGSWCERDLAFDASLMKAGTNTLELTIPPGGLTSGIMYDYLRLELDETARMAK